MKESEALVRLQEIDLALIRDKRTLARMPQTKKLQAVAAARKKLASEISHIVGLRKDAEMDLEENEANHKRLAEIVAEVQEKYTSATVSYREVADLESQLTDLAKRIEKLEFKHGDLVARVDKVCEAERNARAIDGKLTAEGASLMKALKEQAAGIEQDMKELESERAQVVEFISDEVMDRYKEAVRRFDGLAVETVRVSQPSICRVTIPPSSFGDIRRGPSITECPYCHRILVTDGMFSTDA